MHKRYVRGLSLSKPKTGTNTTAFITLSGVMPRVINGYDVSDAVWVHGVKGTNFYYCDIAGIFVSETTHSPINRKPMTKYTYNTYPADAVADDYLMARRKPSPGEDRPVPRYSRSLRRAYTNAVHQSLL